MILPLCLLSLANIGAGFALGVMLGRRHRKIAARRLWGSLSIDLPPPGPVAAPAAVRPVAAPKLQQAVTAPVAPIPPGPPAPKSPGHLAVDDLQGQVDGFGTKLVEADEQLRRCVAEPDLGAIESVLSNIETTARNYVESRESAQQRLADLTRDEGRWEGINNQLVVAAQMQDVEIKAACEEIASFNYESDLAAGCQKIVGRTQRLLNSNDLLRDALQKALADVAQQENRPPEDADRSDPLTGCLNRAGIEADLNAWWAGVPDHSRLCIALIDLDGLAEINQQFGYRTGSQILKAAATLLEDLHTENVRVARFSGQRFLLMFSDVDSSAATEMVERFRQTVDKAHFEHEDFDIRVTVSFAVTRAREEDSPSSVLLRAESVLGEAKRYGRNRTFRHDGKFPGPVRRPTL